MQRVLCLLLMFTLVALSGCEPTPRTGSDKPVAATPNLRPKAIEQIIASARSSDPFLRANAIEAAQTLPDRVRPLTQLGLTDQHPAVRFAALMTLGKVKLNDLANAARPLLEDENPSVRAAAIYALRRTGARVDLTPLSAMLASQDPALRGNAAMVVGLLGDPGAIPMLKETAQVPIPRANAAQDAIIRLQVAEAIVTLGDASMLDAIRAGAYSQFDEVRVLAVTLMGQLGDRRFEKAVGTMLENPPVELQLAAAGALARFGHADGLPVIEVAAGSQIDAVRAQAAMTLGLFPISQAAPTLAKLLDDPVEQVRLAAAAAVVSPARR